MASRDIQDLHPILRVAYSKAIDAYKIKYPNDPQPFTTCTYRSEDEQNLLFKQWNDGKDNNGNGLIDESYEKVTWAKGGESPHNFRPALAFDIAFINIKQKLDWNIKYFKQFADIIKITEPKVEWGGNWKKKPDAPHYQLENWKHYLLPIT